MTVVDVNTGKFTGSGGNLEETVTKNNLEAAEEIVRQLRLRDIGGIIVVDFIDMVLESNRDLVLRRLVECLGRDRTRHQVAEVTSLGLVQMTRKRIGTGLLEAFSEDCEHCQGRGLMVHDRPDRAEHEARRRAKRGGRRGRTSRGAQRWHERRRQRWHQRPPTAAPSPRDVAAMAREHADRQPVGEPDQTPEPVEQDRQPEPDLGKESADTPEPVSAQTLEEPEQPLASDATPASKAPVEEAEPVQPAEPAKPAEPVRRRAGPACRAGRAHGGHVHPAPVGASRSRPARQHPGPAAGPDAGQRARRRRRRAQHDGAARRA